MPETLLYLRQLDAVKGQPSEIAALKCRKRFLEPQNPCHLLKINTKQTDISERTNEHKANAFTLIQAPGMPDLIIKRSLAALHLYKSNITLKGGQYIIFISQMAKLSPWRWNDWAKTGPGSASIGLDPFHPDKNAISDYNHQTHHRKVQENPHYMC